MRVPDPCPVARASASEAFSAATTKGGVLLHPAHQWFVSAAHTTDDVEQTLDVVANAITTAVAAVPGLVAGRSI